MNKIKRCSRDNVCDFLKERLSENKTKGFYWETMINKKTFDLSFAGITFRVSAKDKGVFLSFCPFCGGKPGVVPNQHYSDLPLVEGSSVCPECERQPRRLPEEQIAGDIKSCVCCECTCWSGGDYRFLGTLEQWEEQIEIMKRETEVGV